MCGSTSKSVFAVIVAGIFLLGGQWASAMSMEDACGSASGSIGLSVNILSPLFYGIGGGEIKDGMGPMFLEPIHVGELGGAPVYWSGRPRDCIVVYKAHKRPLWKPVSQERYLLAKLTSRRNSKSTNWQ